MKLYFNKLGEGRPLIIAHGLFGSGDNWQSLARNFARHFSVYVIDLRNHGHSPHDEVMNFDAMAEDIFELCAGENLGDVFLIGHSLGGKGMLRFAQMHPLLAVKIIVADMGIKVYSPQHNQIFAALQAVDFSKLKSRRDVEEFMGKRIAENSVVQFLLKNLYWEEQGQLAWRFNLPVLAQSIKEMNAALPNERIDLDTLFIRGEKSGYVKDEDWLKILEVIPRASLRTIPNAGHWVHAEAPSEFLKLATEFFLAES